MKLKIFISAVIFLFWNTTQSQSTIFLETMGTVSGTPAIAMHESNNGFDNDNYTMTNGGAVNTGDVRGTSPSTTPTYSGGANVWLAASSNEYGFAIEGIDASLHSGLALQFAYRKESASVLADLRVDYWNGAAWVPLTTTNPAIYNEVNAAGANWYMSKSIALPAAAQIENLKIRFKKQHNIAIRLDDIKLTGTPLPALDFNNLQWPGTHFMDAGSNFTAYAKAYEATVTDVPGASAAVATWIGYSAANTNPNSAGWTWIPAAFNQQVGNDDEYMASFGAALPEGIYYYASRFSLNSGPYTYGGFSSSNGGKWNGTSNVSGILVINGPTTVDYANLQTPGVGTFAIGSNFDIYAQVYEPLITTTPAHQGEGISSWIGYSSTNTHPSSAGWTWVAANFNGLNGDPNNDEYVLNIGGEIASPGTYYYASRFQLDSGDYRYGGIRTDGTAGGFWNGSEFISGVLTVTSAGEQEIVVRGVTGSNPTINDGDTSPSGTDNTLFAAQVIGASQTKTFRIQNTGTAALSISSVVVSGGNAGDFSVTASAPYSIPFSGTNFVNFTVTFTPSALGVRNTTLIIANNDLNENPYNFSLQGTGICAPATNTLAPLSGPVGTEVTVTATANNLNGATASFNGIPATVTQISATQIKVIVPPGAVTGNLTTINAQGCEASTTFTVLDETVSSCQGGGALPVELFISQVTDSGADGMSYIEIYNGTAAAVNLGSYSLRFYNNGSTTVNGGNIVLNNVMLAANDVYTVATGAGGLVCTSIAGGNAELADQTSLTGGINFKNSSNNSIGHDHIRLFKNSTHIDSWGFFSDETWATSLNLEGEGANFIRKNTATVPSTTYANADWDITDWGDQCSDLDYSDVGVYDFSTGAPPIITSQPSFSPSCKSTVLSVTADQGFTGGFLLTFQWFVAAPGATVWSPIANDAIYSGADSATLQIADLTGLNNYQYYCQVRENTATCSASSNAVMVYEAQTVVWNGSWSPAAPTLNSRVIIQGNYNTLTHGNFEACSVTVNPVQTLTIESGDYVLIQTNLTVNGNLVVADSGSLVMIDDLGTVNNAGNTQILRTTKPYKKYDYTYWSSPVVAANIGSTFSGWRTDQSFSFNTSNFADIAPLDGFDDNGNDWAFAGLLANMTRAKGYIVMAPTTGSFPTTNTVTFSGTVNNGEITLPLALSGDPGNPNDDFNLIGNPYPSAVSGTAFINANPGISGTLYFWSHVTAVSTATPGPDYSNYTRDDYALFNLTGGTRASLTTPASTVPTGFIASGQGFFVEAVSATNVLFNNSMRSKLHDNTEFFRSANATVSPEVPTRIWLNLQHSDDLFSQQLIGYFDEATLDFDRGYDGIVSKSGNTVSFYSLMSGDHYRIQGRPTFVPSDVVPLGYSTAVSGSFTISVDAAQGLVGEGQNVYLQDIQTGILHDLKQAPYNFTTESGTFNNRFLLRYEGESLDNDEVALRDLQVVVKSGGIQIYAQQEGIAEVNAFDVLGRKVYESGALETELHEINNLNTVTQTLVLKIKLSSGITVTKKVILN